MDGDAEQGIYDDSTLPQSSKGLSAPQEHIVRKHAGIWGYIFQIIFQVNFAKSLLDMRMINFSIFFKYKLHD